MSNGVKIVVPGDDPPQIQGSAQLDRLRERGEVVVYTDRPKSVEEKHERVRGANVVLNSRSIVTWRSSPIDRSGGRR